MTAAVSVPSPGTTATPEAVHEPGTAAGLAGADTDWAPATAAEKRVTLHLLNAVAESGEHSQRSLAVRLDVAVGLANAYVKRCIRKGWIKARSAPARRYLYYVTPAGFAEKARLTGEYLTYSLSLFRAARNDCARLLDTCVQNGWTRVAIVGSGDLAEIAVVSALDRPVALVGLVDARQAGGTLFGLPAVAEPAALGAVDALLLVEVDCPPALWAACCDCVGRERVLVPAVVGLPSAARTDPTDTRETDQTGDGAAG